jgi:hypothetical protein
VLAAAEAPEGAGQGLRPAHQRHVQLKTEIEKRQSSNVVGLIEGSDPTLKAQTIILSAHLDHLGIHGKDADKINNGALDNASGIATMLEVARGFKEAKTKPKRSIVLLAVTAEEKGLIGSEYFANNPTVPKAGIAADVNLDMPILLYDFQDVIAFGADRSTIGPAVARAAGRVGIGLSADPLPEEGLFTRSDHYRFVEQGVPSVFLMTGFKNGGEKGFKDFLATHYHKPNDDLNQPINYQAGARFAWSTTRSPANWPTCRPARLEQGRLLRGPVREEVGVRPGRGHDHSRASRLPRDRVSRGRRRFPARRLPSETGMAGEDMAKLFTALERSARRTDLIPRARRAEGAHPDHLTPGRRPHAARSDPTPPGANQPETGRVIAALAPC